MLLASYDMRMLQAERRNFAVFVFNVARAAAARMVAAQKNFVSTLTAAKSSDVSSLGREADHF